MDTAYNIRLHISWNNSAWMPSFIHFVCIYCYIGNHSIKPKETECTGDWTTKGFNPNGIEPTELNLNGIKSMELNLNRIEPIKRTRRLNALDRQIMCDNTVESKCFP